MTGLRATYRLQLGGGFGFAQARELVPYLRELGVSHLYLPPSFQARAGSTHGYDVVDPARISGELGGEDGSGARRAVHEAGMGIVLDIVPNHMAADDANRFWADRRLRSQFFDLDDAGPAPALLRRRRAGRRAPGGPRGVRGDARAGAAARARGRGGRAADRPPGRARRPGGVPRAAARRGVEHVWVEKILDPGEKLRDWPVDGTVGYEFLNDVCALFVDPAGEAPLTDLWVEVSGDDRRFGELAFEAKLEQARTTFAPEVERLPRDAPERVAGLERALAVAARSTAPTSSRGRGGCRRCRPRGDGGGGPAGLAGRKLLLEDAGLGRVRHPLPADDAAGDGQGRRGHRVLPLRAAARAERRRRRSGALLVSVDEFHAGNAERAARFPRNLLVDPDPRHEALRRRARADRGAGRRCRTSSPRTRGRGSPSAAR